VISQPEHAALQLFLKPIFIKKHDFSEKGAPALPDKPSIAVLSFQNMFGDPEQEYFADGMVEDMITALPDQHAAIRPVVAQRFIWRDAAVCPELRVDRE
jgi:hypothetical protein